MRASSVAISSGTLAPFTITCSFGWRDSAASWARAERSRARSSRYST